MNVMVVGSGGREHALAWGIENDASRLFVAPGNAGTDAIAENVPIEASDVAGLARFATQNQVDLAVIGPDDSLALGLTDQLESRGIAAFGPTKAAARIESSKVYSKNLMMAADVPTAEYRICDSAPEAFAHCALAFYPLVVKADGLALGKGVSVCHTPKAAAQAVTEMMMERQFGDAGGTVVIESYLEGPEISLHAFCDGGTYEMFPAAQDHKTIHENGSGPMTGGMGTVAPLPWITPGQTEKLGSRFVVPVLERLKQDGAPFTGLLYPGLKMTPDGSRALEYNARFGDPEAQVYVRLLKSSLLKTLAACTDGSLPDAKPVWSDEYAVCVVVASEGYPASSSKGDVIEGLEQIEAMPDITVFHAGTKNENGKIVTNGGRVLGITAVAESINAARGKAYGAIDSHLSFKGMQLRRDIGLKAMQAA